MLHLENQMNNVKNVILSKAFKDELGTNDPTNELLKSILQEKI